MKYKLFFTFLLLLPATAHALTAEQGLADAVENSGLGTRKIPEIIAMAIRALLALLGAIFIVLIILGGFRWMTSAGNAQKIEAAKQTLTNAIVGLVIVLAAYAITEFVLRAVYDSTGGGAGAGGDG
jgi:hypothetical protein